MAYLPEASNSGIAAIAHSVGKPGRTEHIGSIVGRRGAGLSTQTGGDPLAHSMGHYGKDGVPLLAGAPMPASVDPTSHAGARMIRGGTGGMRSHIRQGGLGPGNMSTPGPSNTDYSMNSSDTE